MEKSNVWDIESGFEEASGVEGERRLEGEMQLEEESDSATKAEASSSTVDCKVLIAKVIEKAELGDCGAPFEPEALHALLALCHVDYAEWIRVRAELKKVNKKIPLTQLDRAIHRLEKTTKEISPTHHGYAVDALKQLSVGNHRPVAVSGSLYVPCAESCLWMLVPLCELEKIIAEKHDGKENCLRHEDYRSIAAHAFSLASNDNFLAEAPEGLACLNSFISVSNGKVCQVPLGLEHRQIEALDYEPADIPTPLFDSFMSETFRSDVKGEEEDQRRLLEEYSGAAMLGIAPRYQKACFWLDRYGRAGKGTLQQVYEKLVPLNLITGMSPTQWKNQYYMAGLAFKRLNVVGELPESLPIAAAEFKSVLGGDRVMGRHPTGRPFMFKNEAAHLFMSNHMIRTNEHSEAFYARWLLIEFPNSLLKSGLPLDVSLAERIIKSELPGVAYKALQGAERLLRQGRYSASRVHDRLMTEWRRSSSSLEEFIYEECELNTSFLFKRADFYRNYVGWCDESGRKRLSKGRVKETLEHNLKLNIRLATLDGYEIFRGVQKKPEPKIKFLGGAAQHAPINIQPADF